MLVLTRRQNEKVLLPDLQVSVQVVSIKMGEVRLGINAPPDVAILREEVRDRLPSAKSAGHAVGHPAHPANLQNLSRLVRNRVNIANLGVALSRNLLESGRAQDAEAVLHQVDQEFQSLQRRLDEELDEPPPRRRPTALVVEDDGNQRELLAGFLRMAGLAVATADDGVDALDYLHTQPAPDVVLLDMLMPRCDGPTTVRAIRGNPQNAGVKIFALTGHEPEYFHLDPRAAGIDRWFRKPVNPEVLLRDLNQALGPF